MVAYSSRHISCPILQTQQLWRKKWDDRQLASYTVQITYNLIHTTANTLTTMQSYQNTAINPSCENTCSKGAESITHHNTQCQQHSRLVQHLWHSPSTLYNATKTQCSSMP